MYITWVGRLMKRGSNMEFIHLILVVSITIATMITSLKLLFRRQGNERLPPGPAGLPLLGRLPFLSPDLHRDLADMACSYGPIVSFRLGTELCVAITSPSAAMEVLTHHDSIFANRAVPVVGLIANGGVDIVFSPNGPHWRMIRKVAIQKLLSTGMVESFRSLRRRIVDQALGMLRTAEGKITDVRHLVHQATLDITLGMLCEEALKDEEGYRSLKKEVLDVSGGIVDLLGLPNISDFVSALAPLDLQGLQRKMKGLRLRWDAVFERMKSLKASGDKASRGQAKDFLQALLDLVESKDPDMPLVLEHVQGLMLDMISGGTDTTSTTVEWAMTELMRNQEAMVKVQEELDSVVGRDGTFEESHIPQLPYLDAVVKETLRLHPVLPLLVPHRPSATCQLGGYTVPEGTRIFINVWAIQRDPTVWGDPLKFRPQRFLENPDNWDYYGRSFDYFPFGAGRRICVGVNLGERMIMHLLGSLLHSFDWGLPCGTIHVDLEEKFGIVLRKKDPLVLVPTVRMTY